MTLSGVIRSVAAAAAALLLGGAPVAQARSVIQFWHAMDGQTGAAITELVNQFNRSQAEFEVEATYKGVYAETLAAAIRAYDLKSPPHIVQASEVSTQSMLLSRAVVPVHRLMQQQAIAVDGADFIDTARGYYSTDANLYPMPFNASSPVLFFNRDAFRKAGLPDAPPATWPEVEAASRKLLASGAAKCGFTASWPSWTLLENTFAWHDQPFASNDNGFKGLDTRLLIDSDFGRMHIAALARWQQEGIFVYGGRRDQPDAKFLSGECAMLIQSSGSIGGFKQTAKFAWGTGAIPHWGPPYPKTNSILGGGSLWVLRGHSPADDLGVARFLAFVAEPGRQMAWAAATGYVPITKAALKGLQDSGFYTQNPEQQTAMDQLQNNANPTVNSRGLRLGNYLQVREVIWTELESIFAGKKTVKQGLDAAVTRGNAILREFSLTYKPWPGAI